MKTIEIDDDIYQYIASKTEQIGESASDILRRLLIEAQTNTTGTNNVQLNEISNNPATLEHAQADTTPATTNTNDTQSNTNKAKKKKANSNVFDFLNKEDLNMQKNVVSRFLFILSLLNRAHKDSFNVVLDIKGRNRLYFAETEEELNSSGSSTNPKQIPNSPFWVLTNSNTTRKKMILTEVATHLGYSEEQAEKIREML
ncbi:replication initiation negative regulator SeqA [Flocculibacter collagenilyticus]|uniref:replication initiation negative regulator SeqA n=1 Tax=Flocculibacter collagenilyticus TaxID=2744479 RepID=UPI0018F64C3E|nr:replication initiation negative regulator SeqA [Flocculibacter collagenilyticus]